MHRFSFLIPLLLLSFIGPLASAQVLNGMAARVAGQTVTVRDARFFLGLQRFREGKGDPLAPEVPGELKGAVQKLLLEEMVHAELRSLRFDAGPRSEAETLLAGRKKGNQAKVWASLLKTYGKSDAEAVDRAWKSLQAEKFIQRRVETLTPLVTEADTDKFLKQRYEVQGRKLEAAEMVRLRPQAIAELKKELMRKELEEWVILLKRKYGVVNYMEN
jgi:hypothetical protein